jgi:hypothetical protein
VKWGRLACRPQLDRVLPPSSGSLMAQVISQSSPASGQVYTHLASVPCQKVMALGSRPLIFSASEVRTRVR